MDYVTSTIQYYDQNISRFIRDTVNADMSDLYDVFEDYLRPGYRILDLGCGSGRDSKYFKEQGYSVVAVDASESLCEHARTYAEVETKCIRFEELDFTEEFDVVWACASLLHVSAEELPRILAKVHCALRPRGVLYASFKYGDSERVKEGRYFADFNEAGIRKLICEEAGWEIQKIFVTGDVRTEHADEKWLNIIAERIHTA